VTSDANDANDDANEDDPNDDDDANDDDPGSTDPELSEDGSTPHEYLECPRGTRGSQATSVVSNDGLELEALDELEEDEEALEEEEEALQGAVATPPWQG